jgi:NADP-dependent aldehyde dehydrogenase
MTEVSSEPRTGAELAAVATSTDAEVDAVLAAAAGTAPAVACTAPSVRAGWLRAIADALETDADELVDLADAETALGRPRLPGELGRAASQLRFYADVAEEGSWLQATIDRPTGGSWLGRVRIPMGPVAVFGASNFPFAFSVLGNDTASALAAGCPVVAKGHPAHPRLSRALADRAVRALAGAGAPEGVFGLVTGFESGRRIVVDERIRAVAFTGSQTGGMALRDAALARPVPVPVYAEMGTVNPVVATVAGCRDVEGLAAGFVGSFTLGAGQYCTKPGLLLAPAGHGVADAVARALADATPRGWSLTGSIASSASAGVAGLVAAGATEVARVPGPGDGWSVDTVLLTAPVASLRPGSRLLEECFGPVALVVEYDGPDELATALGHLQGTLVASVMAGPDDDPHLRDVLDLLVPLAGRVTVGDWPTGVAWSWAQQHGGPWPSTSDPAQTSVGAAALDRFTRPVAFQNVPDVALPPALQEANPWRLPRRLDGVWTPA